MQAFTDLVGTTAVPAHAFDIAELTELTPALDTAHGYSWTSADRRVRLLTFPPYWVPDSERLSGC